MPISRKPLPAPSVKDFKVGWIAVIDIEREAAVGVLDDTYQEPATAERLNYNYGRIGALDIVVAQPSQYGIDAAVQELEQMKSHFEELKYFFVVGVYDSIRSFLIHLLIIAVVAVCPMMKSRYTLETLLLVWRTTNMVVSSVMTMARQIMVNIAI
jgi:hypothetical protein